MCIFSLKSISFIITIEIVQRIPSPPHNPVKLVKVQHPVSIPIGLLKHFLQLVIGYLLPPFSRYPLQVLEGDFVEVVLVEEFEDLDDFFLGVPGTLPKFKNTIRTVITLKNSLKFNPSLISFPIYAYISLTSCFLISIPNAFMIAFSSLASISPV